MKHPNLPPGYGITSKKRYRTPEEILDSLEEERLVRIDYPLRFIKKTDPTEDEENIEE